MRIAIALAVLTTTAHANNHEVTVTESIRTLRTSSANAVTDESLLGGALGYAHNVGKPLGPALELWATGTFGWGVAEGQMFSTLSTELDTLSLMIGARARYAWRPRLVASARLDVGTTRVDLAIRDDHGHTATDANWGAMAGAALGFDVYAVHGPRFALGLRAEIGVVATSSIPLTATPESDSEGTLRLEMTAASLGNLDVSGRTFAASLVGLF